MSLDMPLSAPERWDAAARKVKRAKGNWVLVMETPKNQRGQNSKATEALGRRGVVVEVKSRLGHGTAERPWIGWRTWARTK